MKYAAPELVVLGTAGALVLGGTLGVDDNTNPDYEMATAGLAIGLDG